jgi:mono/diheme cytochrome c family protein
MMRLAIRNRLLSYAIALLLAVTAAIAQSGKTSSENRDASVYSELSKVPSKAAARRNPLESDPDVVAAGAKLFELHCAECHGATADGGKKGPSLRAEQVQQATPGTLFWLLTNGVVRRGMPVWSRLPEPQRWQLVSYIRALGSSSKVPSPQ